MGPGNETNPALDWTVDWTVDSTIDWKFQSPGVKGHMRINQQQSFVTGLEYVSFVGYRICYQGLLTVIILTGI